uniref:IMS import disulfide relay-system CHCH-CHCH-like Cx9C domain-containing protein n=1 Tax=Cucumis sativus TaxID=3659 RepID=A0A0A0LB85_CUCSA
MVPVKVTQKQLLNRGTRRRHLSPNSEECCRLNAMDRKDRATASLLKRVLVSCASQAKQYGGCVAAKVPKVERDMCLKEFIALKSCMQNTLRGK